MKKSKFNDLLAALWAYFRPWLLQFSYLIRAIWFFLPGLLFIALGFTAFVSTEQGQDVLEQSLTIGILAKLPIILGLAFWVFTSWYTSRILAYNDNDFHKHAKSMLARFPRLIAYSALVVIGLALCQVGEKIPNWGMWSYVIISFIIFELVSRMALENQYKKLGKVFEDGKKMPIYRTMTLAGLLLVWLTWDITVVWPLLSLFLCQTGAICWVSFRKKLSSENSSTLGVEITEAVVEKQHKSLKYRIQQLVEYIYIHKLKATKDEDNHDFLQTEFKLFTAYNSIAILAVLFYLGIVIFVNLGRAVGSFAFVMLAFAVLLGFANVVSMVSFRTKINWHFVNILVLVVFGVLVEPHKVRVIELADKNGYAQRPDLKTYLQHWIEDPIRQHILADTTIEQFPVYFIIADGGASRSGYWTANVLSHLQQAKDSLTGERPFQRHLLALAGASGGSVGNVTYFSALLAHHQNKTYHCNLLCKSYLGSDFLTYPLARLLGPELINFGQWKDRAAALETSMEYPQNMDSVGMKHFMEIIRGDFRQFLPFEKSSKWVKPILCINTTCMQDGLPGVIANIKDDLFYPRLDVLDQMESYNGIRVSTAMVLGSRFPYFSPAGKLAKKYYVDGGYFDNSGAGPILQLMFEIESIKDELKQEKNDTSFFAVSLNKFKFYVVHLRNSPLKEKIYKKVPPLLNDLAAPLITLMGSYGAQTNFNDHRLKIFLEQQNGIYRSVNLYKNSADEYPMNWSLSNVAIKKMDARMIAHDSIKLIDEELKKLK